MKYFSIGAFAKICVFFIGKNTECKFVAIRNKAKSSLK